MSEKEKREILENLNKKIPQIPEEQKHYILGYMEGINQMSQKKPRKRKTGKQVKRMAGIVKVHHPTLTEEERESRMAQIKKATIQYFKEVEDEREKRNLQSRNRICDIPSEHQCDGQ